MAETRAGTWDLPGDSYGLRKVYEVTWEVPDSPHHRIDLPTGRDRAIFHEFMNPLAIRADGMERAGARKIRNFPNLPRLVQGCFGVSSGCTRTRKRPLRHPWTSPAPIIHCPPPLFSGEAQGCVDAGDKWDIDDFSVFGTLVPPPNLRCRSTHRALTYT